MTTINKKEIEKFSKLATDWWNPNGKFKPLHLFNSIRIRFIKEKLISHFKLNFNDEKPLKKIKILDIGCGGGLLCEPLSVLGANMTGIDASINNIKVASGKWSMQGEYNLHNALAAVIAVCSLDVNITAQQAVDSLAKFTGVKRRCECIFDGKYKNQIKISNKYNSSIIKRVFSPPDDENLNLKLVTKKRKQNIKIKKDNCFRNFFNEILKIINKKKYSFYYKRMEHDVIFRSNLT